jgi:hypothetical protein
MPKSKRARTAYVQEVEQVLYRHAKRSDFNPRKWRYDADWRLILHADSCPCVGNASAVCICHPVDIRHVTPRPWTRG